jgi:PIN domain nuclease of toxin-antitoxin system
VRLLLDSHALLWWLDDSDRLGTLARQAIASPANEVIVSAASVWEIGIKRGIGKVQTPDNLSATIREEGFSELPIGLFHAEQAASLPMHHRDPFDRMLVAQAKAEGLTI